MHRAQPLMPAGRQHVHGQAREHPEKPRGRAGRPVDERGAHDAEVDRQCLQEAVGRPLAREVPRVAMLDAERRDLDHAPHAGTAARGKERARRGAMHGVERRAASIGQHADRVDHHVDTLQPREPRVRIDVAREVDRDVVRAGRVTHAAQHAMPAGFELRAQRPPDEAVRAADEHGHAVCAGALGRAGRRQDCVHFHSLFTVISVQTEITTPKKAGWLPALPLPLTSTACA
ncbi:hypothetical protein P355_1371 [Burkholderia cenocepacia KC-01]|nr:hypothetical protein P355_1371 [Burkholderia cenocepacia KC-01]